MQSMRHLLLLLSTTQQKLEVKMLFFRQIQLNSRNLTGSSANRRLHGAQRMDQKLLCHLETPLIINDRLLATFKLRFQTLDTRC